MSLPLDLNALRLLGASVATEPSRPGPRHHPAASPADSACLATRTNELRHSEERFAAAFRAAPYPQAILNFTTGQFAEANAAFCILTGFSQAELLEHSMPALQATGLLEVLRGPHPLAPCRIDCRNRGGEALHLNLSTQPTAVGGQPHLMLLVEDLTGTRAVGGTAPPGAENGSHGPTGCGRGPRFQ